MKSIKLSTMTLILLAVAVGPIGCIVEENAQSDLYDENSSGLIQPSAERPHCVATSVAQPIGANTPMPPAKSSVPPVRCFATFSEAIFAATSGRVQLAQSATPETVDEQTLNGDKTTNATFAISPNATFVIGLENEHINFQGATFTVSSGVTCVGFTHTFSFANVAGWNDVISSARAFSNCNHSIHFDNIFSGSQIDCGTSCSSMGAMNDHTTTVRWTQ